MGLPAIAPCARCGKVPEPYHDGAYTYLSCDDCYDGAPDSSRRNEIAGWYMQQRTIEDWNEKMEELAGELADDDGGRRRTMSGWNPRYVAYAAAHGRAPDAMMAHDVERFPGGRMAGFIVWINERWREWERANGRRAYDPRSEADHADFTAWLAAGAVRP